MRGSRQQRKEQREAFYKKLEEDNLQQFHSDFPKDPVKAVRELMPSLIERIPEKKKEEYWELAKKSKHFVQFLEVLLVSSTSDLIPKKVLCTQKFFDLVYNEFPKYLDLFLKIQCFNLRPIIKANYFRIKERLPETAKLLHKKGYCRQLKSAR